MNDPDLRALSGQVSDLEVRMTRLEGHRLTDARSLERVEHKLDAIVDTRDENSMASQVGEIRDLMNKMLGIVSLIRWLGPAGVGAGILALVWLAFHTTGH